ncbi:hypothetical protein OROMI_034659 [Orobanche minor]
MLHNLLILAFITIMNPTTRMLAAHKRISGEDNLSFSKSSGSLLETDPGLASSTENEANYGAEIEGDAIGINLRLPEDDPDEPASSGVSLA